MHTTASKGRMLEKEESQLAKVRCGVVVKLQGGCGKAGGGERPLTLTSSWRSRCTWGGGCRSSAGRWGWPSWPASRSNRASEGAGKARFLSWEKDEIKNSHKNMEGWKYTSKHERWCYLRNRICNLFCSLRCAFTVFSKFSYCEHILFALSGKQVFFCLKRKAELVCFSVKWESCVFKMPWNVFQIIIIVFFQLKKIEGVWHNKQ